MPQPPDSFRVTFDPVGNGSLHVEPPIPADGFVPAGTVLRLTATPDAGFAFDSGYYAQPGVWGKMFHESMTPAFEVVVDCDKILGASFVRADELAGFSVRHDIVYAQPGQKRLCYDVFTPDGAKNLPIIAIIHGGAWISNNQHIMRGLAREWVRHGDCVVCSLDYRWLGNGDGDTTPNTMADLIEDIFGALAHLLEHAAQYGGDPNRLALTGDSAGGHLSAVAAVMTNRIGSRGFGRTRGIHEFLPGYLPSNTNPDDFRHELTRAIRGVAPSYGAFGVPVLSRFLKDEPIRTVEAVSPEVNIPPGTERSIPHFMVRGTEDTLIGHADVESYAEALRAAGQPVEYLQVPGAGHAFFDWKPDPRTRATFQRFGVPAAARLKAFFDRVLA